mgnify:FL=1
MRDSRDRVCQHADGIRRVYRLRRLYCKHCRKTHTELPDFMQPFKRYVANVVEAVVDGRSETCPAEESTMRKWCGWFSNRKAMLDARIQALKQSLEGVVLSVLSPCSLLQEIRSTGIGWLSRLTRQLVNFGNEIHTCFACCPSHGHDILVSSY